MEIFMVAGKLVVTLICALICDAILVQVVTGVNERWRAGSVHMNDFDIAPDKPIEETVPSRKPGMLEQAASGPSRVYREMVVPQIGTPKPGLTQSAGAAVFGEAGPNEQAFEARTMDVDWEDLD